jgi:RimJ/RimL family protein N-acetyltransferase
VRQWQWATRGTWSPDRWTFDFAVFLDGEAVGAQGLSAVGFPVRREVATGSWLGLRHQRQGLGQEMRAAVLTLAFGHLGALSAVSGAYQDNAAAIGVSNALGYARDGEEVADREGARVLTCRFRLAASSGRRGWPAVTVQGVDDEVLGMCGAQDPAGHRALPLGGYPHA